MPSATTLGSQTSHGTPLGPGPGSPNVPIGGKPAWRVSTDFHACPLVTPTPHDPCGWYDICRQYYCLDKWHACSKAGGYFN